MDTTVIDLVALDKEKNIVNLIIMDDMDWTDPKAHIDLVQEKILKYVAYIQEGHFNRSYPSVIGMSLLIKIIFEHKPDAEGLNYIQGVQSVLEDDGYQLDYVDYSKDV